MVFEVFLEYCRGKRINEELDTVMWQGADGDVFLCIKPISSSNQFLMPLSLLREWECLVFHILLHCSMVSSPWGNAFPLVGIGWGLSTDD